MKKEMTNVFVPVPSEAHLQNVISTRAGTLLAKAEAFEESAKMIAKSPIRDDATESRAIDLSAKIMDVSKQLDNIREAEVKPYRDRQRFINNKLNPVIKKLKDVRIILDSATRQYTAFKIAQKRREEEAIRKATEMLQEELKELTPEGMEVPTVAPIKAPPIETTVTTKSGAKGFMVRRLKIEIVNPDAVPRKFCDPVRSKIETAIRAGVQNISGVQFEWVEELQIRRA